MKSIRPEYHRLTQHKRLYQYNKPIIALTGGIATGKSTVSKILEKKKFKIIDADKLVKSIYQTEETKAYILKHYPAVWEDNSINFAKLRELFFTEPKVKIDIESFIYQRLPSSFKAVADVITDQDFYIYDVPLLFEKNLENKVDLSIVVYTKKNIQLERLMQRDGLDEKTCQKILSQQMDIEDKKKKADFVLDNSGSIDQLETEVEKLLLKLFF